MVDTESARSKSTNASLQSEITGRHITLQDDYKSPRGRWNGYRRTVQNTSNNLSSSDQSDHHYAMRIANDHGASDVQAITVRLSGGEVNNACTRPNGIEQYS